MAILYDPEEVMPPSDEEAIQRFIRAAAKVGIEADTVRSRDLTHISEYDALFIRETTLIDHPTYRLARRAEKEGLVVMDELRQQPLQCSGGIGCLNEPLWGCDRPAKRFSFRSKIYQSCPKHHILISTTLPTSRASN